MPVLDKAQYYHTFRIDNKQELMRYSDFITESVGWMVVNQKTNKDAEDIMYAILSRLDDLDFGLWIQLRKDQPVAMCVVLIRRDIFSEKNALIWLTRALPEADTKFALDQEILPWVIEMGATTLTATSSDFEPAKERWFRKLGFRKKFEVYERRLLQHG